LRSETYRKIDANIFAKDCVITMVADTYQKFDLILKWAKRLGALRGLHLSKAQVVEGLKDAINKGYVAAYEVSLRSPVPVAKQRSLTLRDLMRPTKYATARLQKLWFYATSKGQRSAKGIRKLSGGKL
jgi:hypothetical protein